MGDFIIALYNDAKNPSKDEEYSKALRRCAVELCELAELENKIKEIDKLKAFFSSQRYNEPWRLKFLRWLERVLE